MNKLNNLDDLTSLRNRLQEKENPIIKDGEFNQPVIIKVAMATCSMASGSREILNYFIDELEKRNINAEVKQTGCMGYCYAEPTVEVQLPGNNPVVFGFVDVRKADEIIENYIKGDLPAEGIIPVNYEKFT